ncbi:transient receptor potential cation channel protein painless-like [Periplaneta americana]|uniref:transient receptor potential cation channel protein painless-like n=1 Tax=Periplaneta americana TaxID=6978 RepID=UPI0037E9AFAE
MAEHLEMVSVTEETENVSNAEQLPEYKKDGYSDDHVAALRQACKRGNKENVQKALVDMEFDPSRDHPKVKPIHWSAESGNVLALQEVLAWSSSNVVQCMRYNRNAIHMAARKGNHETLQLLLNTAGIDVNAVDEQGRTAFHLAADSNVEGDCTEGRFVKCLELLLKRSDLEVNRPDYYGCTALGRALRKSHKSRVLLILQNHGEHSLNVDCSLVDAGLTVRETILKLFPEFQSFLPDEPQENTRSLKPEMRLLAALQRDSLPDFISILRNNGDLVNHHYKEPYHCTILELACLIKEREKFVDAILRTNGNPNMRNHISKIPLLHMTAERLNVAALEVLLANKSTKIGITADKIFGSNVLHWLALNKCGDGENCSTLKKCVSLFEKRKAGFLHLLNAPDARGDTPLHVAARWNLELTLILLSSGASVKIWNSNRQTALHVAALNENKDAVLSLLKYGSNINARHGGGTPLYVAARQRKNEILLLLLKQGADFMLKTESARCLQYIDPHILEMFFDNCIESNTVIPTSPCYMITFNYNFFIPMAKGSKIHYFNTEMQPLLKMSEMSEFRGLLKHPLISSILFLKWRQASKGFYINIGIYSIFLILLTHHMLFVNHLMSWNEDDEENGKRAAPDSAVKYDNLTAELKISPDESTYISASTPLWIFLSLIILREVIQFLLDKTEYLYNPGNLLDVSIILSTLIYCCGPNTVVVHHSASIAILLAWMEFLLIIGRLPIVSEQLEMFKKVSGSFLKLGLYYLPLFLAFALSFNILFHGKHKKDDNACFSRGIINQTSNSLLFIFDTFIMFTGEFEAKDLPFSETPVTSHFIYFLFVCLMALALLNLLNGLAVSDTKAIKDDAEAVSFVVRAHLIQHIENMTIRCRRYPYLMQFLRKFCFFFRDLPRNRLYLYPNDNKIYSDPYKMQEIDAMDFSITRRAIAVGIKNKSKS